MALDDFERLCGEPSLPNAPSMADDSIATRRRNRLTVIADH
ncbi:hypothetical protein [Lacipirellula parvula]|nr:hypothetical protein [Lacipirellula parvula]